METLAEQPAIAEQEQQLEPFDVAASVNQFKYDLGQFGEIKAHTKEQVKNEELSFLCEAVDRASRTSFILHREGNNLVYFKEGDWRPYSSLLETGLLAAQQKHKNDETGRHKFLVDRAVDDQQHGYKLRELQPGQRYTWYSAYPESEARLYGEDFIESCGFNPSRKLGFLYQATCNEDGSVELETQTVDRSEKEAFYAIDQAKEFDLDMDLEVMLGVYDGYLYKKYGTYFFAGRTENEQNAWEVINQQESLIKFHLYKLEEIARRNLSGPQQDKVIKEHTYSVWATLSKRLKAGFVDNPGLSYGSVGMPTHEIIMREKEARAALEEYRRSGDPLITCGGSITIEKTLQDLLDASPEDVFNSMFGKKLPEKYSFNKKTFCILCQAPPKKGEAKKVCGPCNICKGCDKSQH